MGVKVGTFVSPTTTGNQVVTHGLGEPPKALIIISNRSSLASGSSDLDFWHLFGVSDGATSRSYCVNSRHNATGASSRPTTVISASIIRIVANSAGSAVTEMQANLAAWDNNSFTLNWTVASATPANFIYMIIGGQNVNAKVLPFASPTATGTVSYTGVGFAPQLVIIGGTAFLSTLDSAQVASTMGHSIGVYDGTAQGTAGYIVTSGSDQRRSAVDAAAIFVPNDSPTAIVLRATAQSLNADGFTLNWTHTLTSPYLQFALCLAGLTRRKVASFQAPTAAGPQNVTGVGFQPQGLLFYSTLRTGANNQSDATINVGLCDGDLNQGQVSQLSVSAASPTNSRRHWSSAHVYRKIDSSGAVVESAAVSAVGSDGFTLNWSTPDTAQETIYCVALGTTLVVPISLGGQVSSAGAVSRGFRRSLSGALAPTGALTVMRVRLLSVAGALSPTGALIKGVAKGLAGALAPTGAVRLARAGWRGARRLRAVISDAVGNIVGHILP